MLEPTSKCKHSLKDSIVNISQMAVACWSIQALRTELEGVKEVTLDMSGIGICLCEVEECLMQCKKPVYFIFL
jgi:hypothetical protein